MMKKIIFRADGNSETGLGHLYRIFALIEMFKSDFDFVLLTRESTSVSAIPAEYKFHLMPSTISLEEEPDWISTNYPSRTFMIIADGYQFNATYQKKLKEHNYKLIYIDDQIKERMYADVVINHALSVKSSDYAAEPYTKF